MAQTIHGNAKTECKPNTLTCSLELLHREPQANFGTKFFQVGEDVTTADLAGNYLIIVLN